MEQLHSNALKLQTQIQDALTRIGYDDLTKRKQQLDGAAGDPDLWQDNDRAQNILREQSALAKRVEPWAKLVEILNDVTELAAMNDASMEADLIDQFHAAEQHFSVLKEELKFNGIYDDRDAILSIHAGAGGTDAQDWASMLLRMYVRYAEKQGWHVVTIEDSPCD